MQKDILVLDEETKTRVATRILQHYEHDDIIVINKEKIPIGIVTDEDILNKVGDASVNAETTALTEIMSKPLITIEENATLQEATDRSGEVDITQPLILDYFK